MLDAGGVTPTRPAVSRGDQDRADAIIRIKPMEKTAVPAIEVDLSLARVSLPANSRGVSR